MEILAVPVGLLADANAARPSEHTLHLHHEPFGLVKKVLLL
jgi:hypothetical protein